MRIQAPPPPGPDAPRGASARTRGRGARGRRDRHRAPGPPRRRGPRRLWTGEEAGSMDFWWDSWRERARLVQDYRPRSAAIDDSGRPDVPRPPSAVALARGAASGGSLMYKAETRGISVSVQPRFVEEESSPDSGRYFFAYTVEITNNGSEQVQLRSRHWRIVDGRGEMQEVRGAGVVGKQPCSAPASRSATPAAAPSRRPTARWRGPTPWQPPTATASKRRSRLLARFAACAPGDALSRLASAGQRFVRSGSRFVAENAAKSKAWRVSRLQRDRESLAKQCLVALRTD